MTAIGEATEKEGGTNNVPIPPAASVQTTAKRINKAGTFLSRKFMIVFILISPKTIVIILTKKLLNNYQAN